ncbi:hypothetical protein [Bdellovibrio sp. HCB337]|uniref:hypothetical protein n=1 Tax=Bdellovibrio sp. HCB337 TaxID=3394358 RepID=UPI0039A6E6E4
MKAFVMSFFGFAVISSSAWAGNIVCKGGILSNKIDRFSTLTPSGPDVLTGYKANHIVGGFTFIAAKNSAGRMDLSIRSDSKNDEVIGEADNADSLTIPVGKGYKASVFCGEE